MKEAEEDDGINNDLLHTSFKYVEEEATPIPVNFDAGEKMVLVIHFLTERFNQENIRTSVLDRLIDEWNVNFWLVPFSSTTFICKDKESYAKMALFCFIKLKSVQSLPGIKLSMIQIEIQTNLE